MNTACRKHFRYYCNQDKVFGFVSLFSLGTYYQSQAQPLCVSQTSLRCIVLSFWGIINKSTRNNWQWLSIQNPINASLKVFVTLSKNVSFIAARESICLFKETLRIKKGLRFKAKLNGVLGQTSTFRLNIKVINLAS